MLNNKGDWSTAPSDGQFMLDIKRQYLANLGNVPGCTYETLSDEKLEKKLELCREYLKMLNVVHPGYNYQKSKYDILKNMIMQICDMRTAHIYLQTERSAMQFSFPTCCGNKPNLS